MVGWKEKLLSFAGREVLIKSILMAVPMMCFKIPDSVCKRMSSIIYRYWWSSRAEERTIHRVKSSSLNKAKTEGGMNFRDLRLVNDALLAKQFLEALLLTLHHWQDNFFKSEILLRTEEFWTHRLGPTLPSLGGVFGQLV